MTVTKNINFDLPKVNYHQNEFLRIKFLKN